MTRIAYRAPGGERVPADVALNLPTEKHSYGLLTCVYNTTPVPRTPGDIIARPRPAALTVRRLRQDLSLPTAANGHPDDRPSASESAVAGPRKRRARVVARRDPGPARCVADGNWIATLRL